METQTPVNLQFENGVLSAYFDADFEPVAPANAVLRKQIDVKTGAVIFVLLKEGSK